MLGARKDTLYFYRVMLSQSAWVVPRVTIAGGHGSIEVAMHATAPWWDFVAHRNIRAGLHRSRLAVSDLDDPRTLAPFMCARYDDYREQGFRWGAPLEWSLVARHFNSPEEWRAIAVRMAEAFHATDMLGRSIPVHVVDDPPQ